MNVFQIVGLAICIPLALLIILAAAFSAATGRDIQIFEQLRETDPRRFRKLKLVGRFNGPICVLGSAGGIVMSLFAAADPREGVDPRERIVVALAVPILCVLLWLTTRWATWSWRA